MCDIYDYSIIDSLVPHASAVVRGNNDSVVYEDAASDPVMTQCPAYESLNPVMVQCPAYESLPA